MYKRASRYTVVILGVAALVASPPVAHANNKVSAEFFVKKGLKAAKAIKGVKGVKGVYPDLGGFYPDAFYQFGKFGYEVVDGVKDEFVDRLYPRPSPYPLEDYTPPPLAYAPTPAPPPPPAPKELPLPENPCGDYVKAEEILYVDFDPTKVRKDDVCKYLSNKFLSPFDEEEDDSERPDKHHYHKMAHKCKYYNPMGGYVDPYSNDGSTYAPYAPQGVTVVAKGSCSNFYFNPSAHTKLDAPEVDEYGKCKSPRHASNRRLKAAKPSRVASAHSRRRRLDPAHEHGYGYEHEQLEYGMPYPVRTYKSGFDYLLQCTCACSGPTRYIQPKTYGAVETGYGHKETGYGHKETGYGHKETGYGHQEAGYGHQEAGYGHEQTGYGHQQTRYGHEDTGYGHEEDTGYGHEETGYAHNPLSYVKDGPSHDGYGDYMNDYDVGYGHDQPIVSYHHEERRGGFYPPPPHNPRDYHRRR